MPTFPDAQILNLPTGSIYGMLTYPSEGIPPLSVVAFRLEDGAIRYIDTAGSPTVLYYEFELPIGTYNVVAYCKPGPNSGPGPILAGGYTQAVLCGLKIGCNDHTLIPVIVAAGSITMNIDPGDWYVSLDVFPPMPKP
jgi:hypothetical protein